VSDEDKAVRKLKRLTGATQREAEAKATAWLGSRKGKIVYSAPVGKPPLPIHTIKFEWEVEVEYEADEVSQQPSA
jgi:hypothetical protein